MSTCWDVLALVAWCAVGCALGGVWLFVRSSGGAVDIAPGDARVGAAIALATPPAWFAWFASGVLSGRTWGQARTGVFVAGSGPQRALRVAAHPLAGAVWAWLVLVLLAAGQILAALVTLIVLGAVILGAAVSLGGWVFRPAAPAVHDRIARTRVLPVEAHS